MNKFLNTFLGFSLLAGTASFAEDKYAALYPEENNDSPSYIKDYESTTENSTSFTLAKSSISNTTLKAIYGADA